MDHLALNRAIADFALLTFENQEAMRGHVGPADWQLNLDTGTLNLGRDFRVAHLGTWSEHSRTWLWGWANRHSELPQDHPVLAPSLALRARAAALNMPELDTAQFETQGINDMHWLPAAGLASVAAHLMGSGHIYSGGYDGGRVYVAILDAPPVQANPIKLPRFTRQAWEAAFNSPTWPADGLRHRQALSLYAIRRGLRTEPTPAGGLSILWPQGSIASFEFDENGAEVHARIEMQPGDVPARLPFEEDPQETPPT